MQILLQCRVPRPGYVSAPVRGRSRVGRDRGLVEELSVPVIVMHFVVGVGSLRTQCIDEPQSTNDVVGLRTFCMVNFPRPLPDVLPSEPCEM